jgi:proteasome lid subunit RPN8/RPN11
MTNLSMAVSLRDQIVQETRAAFPRECCGLLEGITEGESVRIDAAHPTRNLAESEDRFEIDPREQFALLRAARDRGREIVGCYHSHPNGRPEPSPRDLENAGEEGFVWLIASLAGADVNLRVFIYSDRRFQAVTTKAG